MLKTELIEETQEQIRRQVRELSDEQRKEFYKNSESKLKDPDTYATLNYIFIAGLHHFYLGKWLFGFINIAFFWGGVICLFINQIELGIILLVAISLFELIELFQSQAIVKNHNNITNQEILNEILKYS